MSRYEDYRNLVLDGDFHNIMAQYDHIRPWRMATIETMEYWNEHIEGREHLETNPSNMQRKM